MHTVDLPLPAAILFVVAILILIAVALIHLRARRRFAVTDASYYDLMALSIELEEALVHVDHLDHRPAPITDKREIPMFLARLAVDEAHLRDEVVIDRRRWREAAAKVINSVPGASNIELTSMTVHPDHLGQVVRAYSRVVLQITDLAKLTGDLVAFAGPIVSGLPRGGVTPRRRAQFRKLQVRYIESLEYLGDLEAVTNPTAAALDEAAAYYREHGPDGSRAGLEVPDAGVIIEGVVQDPERYREALERAMKTEGITVTDTASDTAVVSAHTEEDRAKGYAPGGMVGSPVSMAFPAGEPIARHEPLDHPHDGHPVH